MATVQSVVREFEIAPGVKNTDWLRLNLIPTSSKQDWGRGVRMFKKRIGRFLKPVKALMESSDAETIVYSGFAIMALDCLLIETLQSFRVARPNPVNYNDRKSTQTIVDFLTQRRSFRGYFDDPRKARLFCNHFRNGILHQGEVKSSGLIRIDKPEMIMPSEDNESFVVDRWKFHSALVQEVKSYIRELVRGTDIKLRQDFITKMNEISRVRP